MAPVGGAPRELLWYHQIQRENRHILERINKQQADMDEIKSQLLVKQGKAEQAQQLFSELEAKQVTDTERRREDFEREKDMLKRIGELEDSVQVLRKVNDSRPVVTGTASQWQSLEQRLDSIENNQIAAPNQDMQQPELKMGALERAMSDTARRSVDPVNQAAEERVSEPAKGVILSVPQVTAASFLQGEKAKDTATQVPESERQSNERPPVQKRRLGRGNMPFRPTPPDMGW